MRLEPTSKLGIKIQQNAVKDGGIKQQETKQNIINYATPSGEAWRRITS